MLKKNILQLNHIQKKFAILLIILIVLGNILLSIWQSNSYAAQYKEPLSDKIKQYPGYEELINQLKLQHPNWNFTIFYTGLDWSQVIKNETTAWHGRNLVSSGKTGDWICSICGDKKYDNGSWRCASEAAVSYYMDPRNALDEDNIFQFENLAYNGSIQNKDGVNQILKDVYYMQGDTINYIKTDGTTGILYKSFADVIMEASQEAGISPYHLASRIRQEQGTGNSPSPTASGNYSGYIGYYNFLNINASGSGNASIIQKALTYAKNNGLDDPEKSIKAGAKFLAKEYIGRGQSTLYLQKFDVDNSDGTLYYHQYMQNVSAARTEGIGVKQSYEKMGMLNSSINFVIPVYENMPYEKCPLPGTQGVVTQNVQITENAVRIRESKSTSSAILATLNKGDTLLRIEIANVMENGYYWDKVVLNDGRKGYVARNYLLQIADTTNCNERVIANESVNLRNGPGTSNTKVITTLVKGQSATRIETGKYNGLDGYNWDRVKLSDGRQGYIASKYLDKVENNGTSTNEIVKVVCRAGVKIRETPGTDKKILTYANQGDILTRIERDSSTANGYIWDKIVTGTGVTGYVARGDENEPYIEAVKNEEPVEPTPEPLPETNESFTIKDNNIVCIPSTTVGKIKEANPEAVIKSGDIVLPDVNIVGTGNIVQINGKQYTIIKLGDLNGDGVINTGDSLMIARHILNIQMLGDNNRKMAADLNGDGAINTGDSLILRKYIIGTGNITI